MTYDLSQARILIVEDMQPMLTLTTSMLSLFGFANVYGAKSVEEGFRLFCQHNHDIVVTDWLMEPFDGLDLIRMIRHDDASPNRFVPILLMTGYSDQPRVEAARDMGVTEFLVKPYSARDMYARIVQIIEKPRQFVDTGEFFGPDRRRRKNFAFYGRDRRGSADKNFNEATFRENPDMEDILHNLQEDAKKV